MGIEHSVRFAGQSAAHHVHDRHNPRSLFLRLTRCGQRVRRLAGLRDRNKQIVFLDQRVAITELTGDIHLHRRAHHLLQQIFPHQPRMPRGAASHDPNPADCGKLFWRQTDIWQIRLAGIIGIPPAHRVEDRLRLLVNFLQHEMRKATLFRRGGIPGDLRQFPFHRASLDVNEMDIRRGHNRQIPLFEIRHITGMGQHRHDVGGDERRMGRCAHDQRAARARRDYRPRFPLRNDGQRITASHVLGRSSHRLSQLHARLEIFVDQVRDHFRVRFRVKLVSLVLQLLFQRLIVFDDAVMHEYATLRAVRMGILLRGLPVRRPTCVADPHGAGELFLLERLLKIGQLADTTPDFNLLALQHRNASRVVASILQLGQTADENRHRLLISHISDDSTHTSYLSPLFG